MDAQDGVPQQKMTYAEMVEDMNRDLKALEKIERPVTIYKEEKAQMAE